MKNIRSTFKKAVVGLALVAGVTSMSGCGYRYSDGDRVGTVTKISYKGLIGACKSYEGELAMDNFQKTETGGTTNTFNFSVKDPEIVKQIQAAQESGARVKLHYNEVLMNNPCTSDTSYYIISVTPLAAKPQAEAPKL